jgi:hypothetical protein
MNTMEPAGLAKPRLLIFMLSIVVGILSANAFADAAGLPQVEPDARSDDKVLPVLLRILSGVVVALMTAALLPFLIALGRQVVGVLGQTTTRPGPWVAIALVICGTLCLLGTLVFELVILDSAPRVQSVINARNGLTSGRITLHLRTPLLVQLLALCTFLAGVALIALGIWSSIQPAAKLPLAAGPLETGIREQPHG